MSSAKPRAILNDCGCCDGQTASTPKRIENRSGLATIAYRAGDYHSFKESMLAKLSSSDLPVLSGLSTRDQDDYSIALIDAWASVSDVLCFYQEYFANEGLLRTAKERLSVLEHARLIGYQLNPGVAASAYLAFTMDKPMAATDNPVLETTIPAGAQVQSTPGPDETAQLFETEIAIQARVDWNAMRPRLTQPQAIQSGMGSVVTSGITTFVKPGDELLIVNGSDEDVVKVLKVNPNQDTQTTQLKLSEDGVSPNVFSIFPQDPMGEFSDFDGKVVVDETVINGFINHSWSMGDIIAITESKHWDLEEIAQRINTHEDISKKIGSGEGVYGFHKRANFFGYNAMKKVTYSTGVFRYPLDIAQWCDWNAEALETEAIIYLDNDYSEIIPNSYCILKNSGDVVLKISGVKSVVRTEYGISSKSSKLELGEGKTWFGFAKVNNAVRRNFGVDTQSIMIDLESLVDGEALHNATDFPFDGSTDVNSCQTSELMENIIRKATLLVQSEALQLTQVPIDEKISGDRVLLERADLYLRNLQYASISGERCDQEDVISSEVLQIKEVRLEHGFTQLIFTTSLRYQYIRNTVSINANVALASHGESVSEILGSGDASVTSQQFSLKQPPLTYTSADVPSGAASSLEIRVNNVLWHEVETFLGRVSDERIYSTKLNDDGVTQVYFGNGVEGARLPSGNNNVIANYRKGLGLDGLVKAKQLNLLLTRPLGVKDVVNPVASSGADDPEVLADARTNAPMGLLTLDRAVSLSDYEDFSRAFAGISKARAISISQQGVPSIYITIAGPNGTVLYPDSETYKNLSLALKNAGDPYTNFSISPYRPAYFKFDAGLYINADYQSDLVLEAARQAMRDAFSFEIRSFNQPVHLSEVIRTLQQVDGVIAVDLNHLYRSNLSPVEPPPRSIMPKLSSSDDEIVGAELIMLDPAPIDQLRVKS